MRNSLHEIIAKVQSGSALNAELDVLETKIQIMLTFSINLAYYFLKKSNGDSINSSKTHIDLIRTRMLLSKFRPIQAKLENQIERALKSSKEVF